MIVTRAAAPFETPPEPYSGAGGVMALRSEDLPALVRRGAADPAALSDGVAGGVGAVAARGASGVVLLGPSPLLQVDDEGAG